MAAHRSQLGIGLAFVCLAILAVLPIIADSRPQGSSALLFAFFVSVWQCVCAVPMMLVEARAKPTGIFATAPQDRVRGRTILAVVLTGSLFGLATYAYVLAVEKAGVVSAAIATQAYPLFAILLETVFLGRRKTALELGLTVVMLVALAGLATGGTWRLEGLSPWFLVALTVPVLWSIAHVFLKEVLVRTTSTPAQVVALRVVASIGLLGALLLVTTGGTSWLLTLGDPALQGPALVMGVVYYLELVFWFHAVRHIDVSLASSITVPAPALTTVIAVAVLGENVATYQIAALLVIALCLYGLLLSEARKRRE